MINEETQPTIEVTKSDVNPPYHYYEVKRLYTLFESGGKDSVLLLASSLLEIADCVAQNRTRLEQEAEQDNIRQEKAVDAEMQDMNQIRRGWHDYRNQGLGSAG